MGGCVRIFYKKNGFHSGSSMNALEISPGSHTGFRKNFPLSHETIKWRSDVPLTIGQLNSRRDEFWDTVTTLDDGRKEVWEALRAAVLYAESLEFRLAQAIIDGAKICTPNGYLTECYDSSGKQYKVPIYCLSYPINIVKEKSGSDSPAEFSEPVDDGNAIYLTLRISVDCSEIQLLVFSKDTIFRCKSKLQATTGIGECCQRWFYSGKLLVDKALIEDLGIQPGFIVQVIVNKNHANHKL